MPLCLSLSLSCLSYLTHAKRTLERTSTSRVTLTLNAAAPRSRVPSAATIDRADNDDGSKEEDDEPDENDDGSNDVRTTNPTKTTTTGATKRRTTTKTTTTGAKPTTGGHLDEDGDGNHDRYKRRQGTRR